MKMKEKHPYRAAALIALALLLALGLPSLCAAAAEPITTTAEATVTEARPTVEATVTEARPTVDAPVTASPAEEDAAPATVGGAIGDFLREHLSGILSGATLTVTLVASLALRRRILPSLIEALSALLGKSREAVGAITEGNEATRAAVDVMLKEAEGLLGEARAAAERAEQSANALNAAWGDKATLARVLTEQSTLLYELLMSANLPQYEKDRIGSVHAAVLAALKAEAE